MIVSQNSNGLDDYSDKSKDVASKSYSYCNMNSEHKFPTHVVKMKFSADRSSAKGAQSCEPAHHPAIRSESTKIENDTNLTIVTLDSKTSTLPIPPPERKIDEERLRLDNSRVQSHIPSPERQRTDMCLLLATPIACTEHHLSEEFIFFIESNFWWRWCRYTDRNIGVTPAFDIEPGPINNYQIIDKNEQNNETIEILITESFFHSNLKGSRATIMDSTMIDNMSEKFDYVWLTKEAWNALFSWYGGGPVVKCHPELLRKQLKSLENTYNNNIIENNKDISIVINNETVITNDKKDAISPNEILKMNLKNALCYTCHSLSADYKLGRGEAGKFNCSKCHGPRYCSKECQRRHWPYHKLECKEIKPTENTSTTTTTLINKKKRPSQSMEPGCVGLNNIGNSCYLSASLQTMSHIAPLTRLLLSGRHEEFINCDNKDGSGNAELVQVYTNLLKELWFGKSHSISPSKIKEVIGRLNDEYTGFGQHDAHDLLELLLDR